MPISKTQALEIQNLEDDFLDDHQVFCEITNGIQVEVQSFFLDNQSEPETDAFFWAYRIKISNKTSQKVQLISRNWTITQEDGQSQQVVGTGVVGMQPMIDPDQSFLYTSGTPLSSPSGIMHGFYDIRTNGNEIFKVKIPAFSLDSPYGKNALH